MCRPNSATTPRPPHRVSPFGEQSPRDRTDCAGKPIAPSIGTPAARSAATGSRGADRESILPRSPRPHLRQGFHFSRNLWSVLCPTSESATGAEEG